MRAGTLAQKILASDIALGLNDTVSFYTPDNWSFLNNTEMPLGFNYMKPSTTRTINGQQFTVDQSLLVVDQGDGTCISLIEGFTDSAVTQYIFGQNWLSQLYV